MSLHTIPSGEAALEEAIAQTLKDIRAAGILPIGVSMHALLPLQSHLSELLKQRAALLAPMEAFPPPAKAQAQDIGPEWRPCRKRPVIVHVREQRPGEQHASTREGITPVKPDDLIMRGVEGEEYPIGRDLFNKTYDLVDEAQAQGGEGLPSPLNGDFDCPKAAAARACPCGFCRALRTAPPSAPVGVEDAAREVIESINRFRDAGTRPGEGTLVHWEATLHRALAQQPADVSEVTRQLIERDQRGLAKYGATLDRTDLSLADWLQHMAEELMDAAGYALAAKREAVKQPAAVDGGCPAPRNRAEAAALARLALAHLGVIDAHIDAAIARCETNSAAHPGGSDNDR